MSRNSIGKNLILTSFGESHGPFVGAVLDGFPSGFTIDFEALNTEMQRRRPGQAGGRRRGGAGLKNILKKGLEDKVRHIYIKMNQTNQNLDVQT